MLREDALLDVQKVIALDSRSYLGYQLKHAALHGAQRYDEAIEAFQVMLSKLDSTPNTQVRGEVQIITRVEINALHWVGKSSAFNSYLPADISLYEVSPRISSRR